MKVKDSHTKAALFLLVCGILFYSLNNKLHEADELYKNWRIEFNAFIADRNVYPPMWNREHGEHLDSYKAMVHSSNVKLNDYLLKKIESSEEVGDSILAYVLCDRMGWDLDWVYSRHPREFNVCLAICAEYKKVPPSVEYWSSQFKFDTRGIMRGNGDSVQKFDR